MEAWSHSSPSVHKWTKHTVAAHLSLGGLGATPVGTPQQVADELERWVEEADVDGFNFVSRALFTHLGPSGCSKFIIDISKFFHMAARAFNRDFDLQRIYKL